MATSELHSRSTSGSTWRTTVISIVASVAAAVLTSWTTGEMMRSQERDKAFDKEELAYISEFQAACAEIWRKEYAYQGRLENATQEIVQDRPVRELSEHIKPTYASESEEFRALTLDKETKPLLEEISVAIQQNRYVIGEDWAGHFYQYAGLVRKRAEWKVVDLPNEKITQGGVDGLDQKLGEMRFDSMMARKYAIRELAR